MASNIPSIVSKFVEEFPDVSKRQVQIKVTEITIKKPKNEIVPGSKSTMGIYVVAPEVDIPTAESQNSSDAKGKSKTETKNKGTKKDGTKDVKTKKKRKRSGQDSENGGGTGANNTVNGESDNKTSVKKSKKPITSFNLFVKQSRPEVERSFAHITETLERTKAIKADLMKRWNDL